MARDFLAEPQRMDVAVGRIVAAGAGALRRLTVGQLLPPALEALRGLRIDPLAEVDGTCIMMFPFDHDPPRAHAFGGDFRAKLAISDARVLETRGTIAPAVMRRLRQWVLRHRGWLNQLWRDARRGNPISRIDE